MKYKTIGIDLGHCETAAALPIQPVPNDTHYKVRRMDFQDKDHILPTQLILTDEQMEKLSGNLRPTYEEISQLGEIQIGKDLSFYVPNGEKFCYFKVPPRDFDKPYGNTAKAKRCGITHGQLIACFAFALIQTLFKYNQDVLTSTRQEDLVLLIGCPTTSDWTDKQAELSYAELIQKATNVRDVRIIPESRAAMFSSVENEKNAISAIKGAVVFDFGSSTADCTYMLLGRKIIEFSWTLGASEVERQMTLEAYQKAVALKGMFFDVETNSFSSVVEELRNAKEFYYNGKYQYEPNGHLLIFDFQIAGTNDCVEAPVRINDAFMQKAVGEKTIQILCDSTTPKSGTWMSLCEAFFEEARKRILSSTCTVVDKNGKAQQRGCEIDTIVLTGGASKMGFVYDLCKKVFSGITIRLEDNPAQTVSNGLGWVAVSDDNLDLCRREAKAMVDADPKCSFAVLKSSLEDALFGKVKAIAEQCTQEWADAPGDDLTLQDLDDMITGSMEDPRTKAEIIAVCSDAINQWKGHLSNIMEQAVNTQVNKLYSESVAKGFIIPPDIWKALQASGIKLDALNSESILGGIDVSSLGRQIAQWAIVFAAVAVGAAVAGILGAAIAYVGSVLLADLLSDGQMDKPRTKKKRQKVVKTVKSQIPDKKAEILKEFSADIDKYEASFSSQIDEALTVAFEIVTLKRFEM